MGTDQNTTSLTGVGSPLGGTYQWQVGPRLSFQGPAMGQNVSIVGTGPSVSGMDTFVSVTYTVNGTSATASIRVTVEVPTQFVAENFPGGPGWTTTVTGTSSGYLTTMTYYIYAQGPLGVDVVSHRRQISGGSPSDGSCPTRPSRKVFRDELRWYLDRYPYRSCRAGTVNRVGHRNECVHPRNAWTCPYDGDILAHGGPLKTQSRPHLPLIGT